jgi:hypothetical protein
MPDRRSAKVDGRILTSPGVFVSRESDGFGGEKGVGQWRSPRLSTGIRSTYPKVLRTSLPPYLTYDRLGISEYGVSKTCFIILHVALRTGDCVYRPAGALAFLSRALRNVRQSLADEAERDDRRTTCKTAKAKGSEQSAIGQSLRSTIR